MAANGRLPRFLIRPKESAPKSSSDFLQAIPKVPSFTHKVTRTPFFCPCRRDLVSSEYPTFYTPPPPLLGASPGYTKQST
eukprot:5827983-Prymnesium_polylepis.1